MSELIECFGEAKTIMDWLLDKRCHPEMSYDVLRKRLKRPSEMSIPEMALTVPVIKGAQVGDTKARAAERKKKARERYKMFVLCQKVRDRYNAGVERAEIKARFDISESYLQKIISGQYGFNGHWDICKPGEVPEHFKKLKEECESLPGVNDGLEKYEVKES
jgi:hypothetical protein